LIGDESVEVGIGEAHTLALSTAPDVDVGERAAGDVALKRLNRTTEFRRSFRHGAQAVGRPNAGGLHLGPAKKEIVGAQMVDDLGLGHGSLGGDVVFGGLGHVTPLIGVV
jgi:hypothetical protein